MAATFSHSGDFGDLIAHLPVVRGLGGGRVVLFPSPATGGRMTPERAAAAAPLLEAQPYVAGVEWAAAPAGEDLDAWRHAYRAGKNLTDMACLHFGVRPPPRAEPWLAADPDPVAPVVFARSPRYHSPLFPWDRVHAAYHKRAVFVGLPAEHAAFCRAVGDVPYHPTADLLALARVIRGAALFVGNQSAPFWVAEGLKTPTLLEVCLPQDNCRWFRRGAYWGTNRRIPLPEVP